MNEIDEVKAVEGSEDGSKETDNKEEKETLGSFLKTVAIYMTVGLLLRLFIFNITSVYGTSMLPTLVEGDKVITSRITMRFKPLERGDIVVIKAPDGNRRHYIKRVIGIPGDEVSIVDRKLYVNKKVVEENYTSTSKTDPAYFNDMVVNEGQIYVLGDNRFQGASKDSRYFGTVDISDVIGVSVFRFWPLTKIGFL